MAQKVTVQVLGGEPKVLDDVATIAEVMQQLGLNNHSASINGQSATLTDELEDYSFVTLSPSVKGGSK
jgi:uncharacterized radical SAM superfamily Fe-S cluster-containing enzyme